MKINPQGMEHHERDFAVLKIPHYIIKAHQEIFPNLAHKMKMDPANATNIYAAFLSILVLRAKHKLTPNIQKEIMKTYKLLR